MRSRPLAGSLLALIAIIPACKSRRPAEPAAAASSAATTAATTAAVAAAPITVTSTEFKFDLPDTIPAGAVALRLVDHGKELHQAQLVRLEEGKTAADFQAAMEQPGPPPAWAKFVGGPNAVAPGQEGLATAVLAPGSYVVICLIPGTDGVPHAMKGMVRPFEVTGTAAAGAGLPEASDTMRLNDFTFESSRPLAAGPHVIRVENAAQQAHELVLLRLAPGKSVADFATWATTGGMKGSPPAMPIGGVAVLDPGAAGSFSTDLSPGRYGLICFVPDAKDGRPHLMHGMLKEFKVE